MLGRPRGDALHLPKDLGPGAVGRGALPVDTRSPLLGVALTVLAREEVGSSRSGGPQKPYCY